MARQSGRVVAISVSAAAVILVLAVLWRLRRRWRGAVGRNALLRSHRSCPLLGFCQCRIHSFILMWPIIFSTWPALGIITLAAAGVALLLDRWRLWGRPGGYAVCLALLAVLAGLTWRQCGMYSDNETLYRTVVAENPDCWMGHVWVGIFAARRGQVEDAIAQFEEALRIKPDSPVRHNNMGLVLAGCGRIDEAIDQYRQAAEGQP